MSKRRTGLTAVAAYACGGAFLGEVAWLAAVGAQGLVGALVLAMAVPEHGAHEETSLACMCGP